MNEEKETIKKEVIKPSRKKLLKVLLVAAVIIGMLLMFYIILGDDFKKMSEKNAQYSTKIDPNGNIIYVKTNEDGEEEEVTIDDMIEDFKEILDEYINCDEDELDEKIEYLINAEAVTKLPYITPEERAAAGEESSLQGQVKFYRYQDKTQAADAYTTDDDDNRVMKEQYRLTYVSLEQFEGLKEKFEKEGSTEVYKHFTIDEEGNVIIAYGSAEQKTITTDDTGLTLDIINQKSGETYTGSSQGGFTSTKYTLEEKKIDYLSQIEKDIMPSNLLYALLIQTKDIAFVEAIAKLAYDAEIAIGIYDNASDRTTSKEYKYQKILNIQGHTELDFSNVNTTSPSVSSNSLYNSPYSLIPRKCSVYTSSGRAMHKLDTYYLPSEHNYDDWQHSHNMYIVSTDANGKVASLGTEGTKAYQVSYTQVINAKSTPTIGIILADTWVAKREIDYVNEGKTQGPKTSDSELENDRVIEYGSTEAWVNAFAASATVQNQLNSHAGELKSAAIDRILEKTDFTVTPETITVDDITEERQIELLADHLNGECQSCMLDLEGYEDYTVYQIHRAITETNGVLRGTYIQLHYNRLLQAEASRINTNNEQTARNQEIQRRNQFKAELQNQISVSQELTGSTEYVSITCSITNKRVSAQYKAEQDYELEVGEKFKEIFNDPKYHDSRQAILQRTEWFWEYIRQNEDTEKLEDVIRILLNVATDSDKFGEFSEEDIKEMFDTFEIETEDVVLVGTVSPFGCNLTREEFIEKAEAYGESILSSIAGDFYDVCTKEEYNVNPAIAYAWAAIESEWGKSAPYKNLFGMNIGNGMSSGTQYDTYADSIEDFCKWVIQATDIGSDKYNFAKSRAEEYATVNSKFNGTPENNIYALFCTYYWLGYTHIADEKGNYASETERYADYAAQGSNWGSGGRIAIYYMYEHYLYDGQYSNRCTHKNGSDETTLQERADYAQYNLEVRLDTARDVFGSTVFLTGSGSYQELGDEYIKGIYTSTSGRRFTEWCQSYANDVSAKPLFDEGLTMASAGCGVYATANLLSSTGIDPHIREVYEAYMSNNYGSQYVETGNKILKEYGVDAEFCIINGLDDFIAKLSEGRGIMNYQSAGDYTSNVHWVVVADIRETQLGSDIGYDVYVLTSSIHTTGGWAQIERIVRTNLYWGYYINDEGYIKNTSAVYPEEIKTFEVNGYTFPNYPQESRCSPYAVNYLGVHFGGTKLDSSYDLVRGGCGVFSASCIVSGILGDASVDPISYLNNLDEYFPDAEYANYGGGGNDFIWDSSFIKKYYRLNAESKIWSWDQKEAKTFFEEQQGKCGAVVLGAINGERKALYVVDTNN